MKEVHCLVLLFFVSDPSRGSVVRSTQEAGSTSPETDRTSSGISHRGDIIFSKSHVHPTNVNW